MDIVLAHLQFHHADHIVVKLGGADRGRLQAIGWPCLLGRAAPTPALDFGPQAPGQRAGATGMDMDRQGQMAIVARAFDICHDGIVYRHGYIPAFVLIGRCAAIGLLDDGRNQGINRAGGLGLGFIFLLGVDDDGLTQRQIRHSQAR